MTILIVEQNVELMRRVAHRAHVLEKGRIVATLGGTEIRDGEAARRAFGLMKAGGSKQ